MHFHSFFPRAKLLVILGANFVGLSEARATSIRRQTASVTPLSPNQIASFKPYTFYASTGYCQPSHVLNWSCGGSSFTMSTKKIIDHQNRVDTHLDQRIAMQTLHSNLSQLEGME